MGGAGYLTRDQGDRTHYLLELLLHYTDFLCYPWQVSCALVQCKPGYLCQPKRAQTSPWGPSQGLNYRQNECALVQNTQCAKGFVTVPWVPMAQFMWWAESTASPVLSSSPNSNKMQHTLCMETGWNSNTWDTTTW